MFFRWLRNSNNFTPRKPIPIGSMYGIYANIWGILMVNVTIYSIHGSYGIAFLKGKRGLDGLPSPISGFKAMVTVAEIPLVKSILVENSPCLDRPKYT